VKSLGAIILKTVDFPDQYARSTYEIRGLLDNAKALNARCVTTAKDAVRIPASLRGDIIICDVEISMADNLQIETLLKP
jgi:tetraacyldisaccharide 4'-kinase